MLKQVFLAHFDPVGTFFSSRRIPTCLENGPFLDPKMAQKWVENVFFQKRSWTVRDVQTSVLSPFQPVVTRFGPQKIPNCLKKGLFWGQKGIKKSQKRTFPKGILDHFACSKEFCWPDFSAS